MAFCVSAGMRVIDCKTEKQLAMLYKLGQGMYSQSITPIRGIDVNEMIFWRDSQGFSIVDMKSKKFLTRTPIAFEKSYYSRSNQLCQMRDDKLEIIITEMDENDTCSLKKFVLS